MNNNESNDPRTVLLQLCASITLADHIGDVAGDVETALRKIGVAIEWDDLNDLGDKLGEMGVTTLYGTSMRVDDDSEREAESGDA